MKNILPLRIDFEFIKKTSDLTERWLKNAYPLPQNTKKLQKLCLFAGIFFAPMLYWAMLVVLEREFYAA